MTVFVRGTYWRLGFFRGDPQFKKVIEQAWVEGRGARYSSRGERMN